MISGLNAAQLGQLSAMNNLTNAAYMSSPIMYFGGGDSSPNGLTWNPPIMAGGWGVPYGGFYGYNYSNPMAMYATGYQIGNTVGGLAGGVLKGAGNAISGLVDFVC